MVGEDGELPRVKPFKYTYQKEIVMYAYFKKLDYFSTECIYAPFAARGLARDFVKDLEVSTHCLLMPSPAVWMQTFAAVVFSRGGRGMAVAPGSSCSLLGDGHAVSTAYEHLGSHCSSLSLHAHSCHVRAVLPFESAICMCMCSSILD